MLVGVVGGDQGIQTLKWCAVRYMIITTARERKTFMAETDVYEEERMMHWRSSIAHWRAVLFV